MYIKYYCDKCGKEFFNYKDCQVHELICKVGYTEKKAVIAVQGEEALCQVCKNSYLIYGCELNCDKMGRKCNKKNGYPLWEVETNE